MILLTREVNKILEAEGLDFLTIKRNKHATIDLVGKECGMPIMTAAQIKVSNKLSKVEREIIIEDYINPLVSKHKKELLELISVVKDTTAEEAIEALIKKVKTDHNLELKINKHHTKKNFMGIAILSYDMTIYPFKCSKDDSGSYLTFRTNNEEYNKAKMDKTTSFIESTQNVMNGIYNDVKKLHQDISNTDARRQKAREALEEKCRM